MQLISKPNNDPTMTTKPTPLCTHLRALKQHYKPLPTLALFAATTLASLQTQAALPAAIEAALLRAELTPADISIIITPVGDKSASRLPPPIEVVDSMRATTVSNTGDQKVTQNDDMDNKKASSHPIAPSTLVTIEKRTIKKHEQSLQAYTDDVYTYLSLESVPSLLPDEAKSATASSNSHSNVSSKDNAKTSSIKISFSPILQHQATLPRTPASTMKLVPSFIALDTLGGDFVWHTRVYHTGIIIGERLHGDLIVQGSGDPKMTHERLQQLLYQVQKAGIRHINGDIIIDSAIFDKVSKDPAAFDNSPLRPYNASPDGFLVSFSTIGIQSQPLNEGQAQLTYTPKLANYQLPNTVNIRSAACGQALYSLAPQWQSTKLTLNNDLPNSCGEHMFYVAYPDAKDFATRVLAGKWQELGNTLSGKVIAQEAPYQSSKKAKATRGLAALPVSPLPLVSYPSLSLTKQIYDINHFSNNVMTEQVALSLDAYGHGKANVSNPKITGNNETNKTAAEMVDSKTSAKKTTSLYQFGQPASTNYPTALQTMTQWWQNNLSTPPPHLTNGSGLCRDCTVTAENLNELLTYAYSHPSFGAYVNSLGIAGVSGTIAAHSERLPESAATGRAWIKTGTLNNVTSMAGYVKGLSGQDYVVVGLINSEQALNAYTARPVLDAMLDWTAQQ